MFCCCCCSIQCLHYYHSVKCGSLPRLLICYNCFSFLSWLFYLPQIKGCLASFVWLVVYCHHFFPTKLKKILVIIFSMWSDISGICQLFSFPGESLLKPSPLAPPFPSGLFLFGPTIWARERQGLGNYWARLLCLLPLSLESLWCSYEKNLHLGHGKRGKPRVY